MIEIVNPGLFTSVQDNGRFGHRVSGVPVSGAMDRELASYTNMLAGNNPKSALLEFASPGPVLHFHSPAQVALVGGGLQPLCNNKALGSGKPVRVEAGSVIELGVFDQSFWGYLAVRGGVDSEVVLGSRSLCSGVTDRHRLYKGDRLPTGTDSAAPHGHSLKAPDWSGSRKPLHLEAFQGPEFNSLGQQHKQALTQSFMVRAASTRMAYHLGQDDTLSASAITTSAVAPGTIQLTPSGELIALMRDAQTTGGYARILQLPDHSIDALARAPIGTALQFSIKRLQLSR